MKSRHWPVLLALMASPAAVHAQVPISNGENVPGRVFYHCSKHFDFDKQTGGTLEAYRNVAEDGAILAMHVEWNGSFDSNPPRQSAFDIVQTYGAQRGGSVKLTWPRRSYQRPAVIEWTNPQLQIQLYGAIDGFDKKRESKEPWLQTVIARGDGLQTVTEKGLRYIVWWPDMVLTRPAGAGENYWFEQPLGDLLAWGSGTDRLTVYLTRVARRKFTPNSSPNGPGPHRILVEYTFKPAIFAAIAAKARTEVEAWQAETADFRKACTRQVEQDESNIIVV